MKRKIQIGSIAIVTVAYNNTSDVVSLIVSLLSSIRVSRLRIYVTENGENDSFLLLIKSLLELGFRVSTEADADRTFQTQFRSVTRLELADKTVSVTVGHSEMNRGYAAGVNVWFTELTRSQDFGGVLVLNPDIIVGSLSIFELVTYVSSGNAWMGTGVIVKHDSPDRVQYYGLRWRTWTATAETLGRNSLRSTIPMSRRIESCLDAPAGSVMYVPRKYLSTVGLLDEDYFLFYEDLDWGMRVSKYKPIGFARKAIFYHRGGTTIGSGDRTDQSKLATYLSFRNRILFVKKRFPSWYTWTLFVSLFWIFELLFRGSLSAAIAASRGYIAGIAGERGPPRRLR